jgi:hypothetical protein
MTQQDFIDKIRQAYLNARNFAYTPILNTQSLTRGTSHSISSLTEDLFGCYCTEKITNSTGITIHIDPQLSFCGTTLKNKSGKKSLLIRPDIAIEKNGTINCMFDLKTDLGYKRTELFNQAKERNDQVEAIKKSSAKCNDGKTKVQRTLKFSDDLKFIFIVISQGNINKKTQDDFITQIRQLKNVEIYLLTTGDHLNSYHNNPTWQINSDDFNKLDNKIAECLK